MNQLLKKIFALIILMNVSLLAACKEPVTYHYLMLHPSVLQQAYARCEEAGFMGQDCDITKSAGEKFSSYVDERREDPEVFGKKILSAQEELATLQNNLENTKLKLKNQPDDKAAQLEQEKLEQSYRDKLLEMKIYLAVVRATSFRD